MSNMNKDYFVIDKRALPDYFEKVLKAKDLVANGTSVIDACAFLDISRSTYYKYKDYIFDYNIDNSKTHKAIIALLLKHKSGVMLEVYSVLAKYNINIMSLTQSMIVNNSASVEIAMDLYEANINIDELIIILKKLDGVKKVELLTIESI